MRRYTLLLPMLLIIMILRAQSDTSQALKIGQHCPDIVFTNIIRYSSTVARLSDFRGKVLLVEFWAPWCSPCVKGFPKLEVLQKQFENNLQVMLVTNEPKPKIVDFYNMKADLKLPTAIMPLDSHIFKLFPHQEIPFYIWIDKDRIVRATTGSDDITADNIERFVRGEDFAVKNVDGAGAAAKPNPMKLVSDAVARSLANPDTLTIYSSRLQRHNPDEQVRFTRTRYVGPQFKDRAIDRTYDYPIARLYSVAYGGYDEIGSEKFSIYDRVIVESRDKERLNYPNYDRKIPGDSLRNWISNNTYSYTLILPPGITDPQQRFVVMQNDLKMAFGYKCGIEKRKLKCLVLKATGPLAIRPKGDSVAIRFSPYGVTLKNQTLEEFLGGLQKYINGFQIGTRRYLPIINETGWQGPADLQFQVENLSDLELVRRQLSRFNLDCTVEDREVEVVVISDK